MKSKAGILTGVGNAWEVVDIEVDAPKAGEVLVEWKAAGLCHSDEHLVTGDMVPPDEAWPLMGITDFFPIIGGHEGAGIVAEVGPGRHQREAWATTCRRRSFPSCGRCRYCSTGRQNLCDPGGGSVPARHDHRRHEPPPLGRHRPDAVRQARHVLRVLAASPSRR